MSRLAGRLQNVSAATPQSAVTPRSKVSTSPWGYAFGVAQRRLASTAQGGSAAKTTAGAPQPGTPGGGLSTAAAATAVLAVGAACAGVGYQRLSSGHQQATPAAAPESPEERLRRETHEREAAATRAAEAEKERLRRCAREALVEALSEAKTNSTDELAGKRLSAAISEVDVQAALPPNDATLAEAKEVLAQRKLGQRTSSLRQAIGRGLRELKEAVHDQQIAAGRAAFNELATVSADMVALVGEKDVEATKLKFDIHQAKAQLEDLERIEQGYMDLELGQQALADAMQGGSSATCHSAIQAVHKATMELQDLHQAIPDDHGMLAEGVQRQSMLEELERGEAHKATALAALRAAVDSRSPTQCADALRIAEAANLGPTPVRELAGLLAEPTTLVEALAQEGAQQLAEMRNLHGISVADFVDAAKAEMSNMDEGQLRNQASELAATVARSVSKHRQVVEDELKDAGKVLSSTCLGRTADALARFERERGMQEEADQSEMRTWFQRRLEQAAAEVQEAYGDECEARRREQREHAMQAIGDRVLREREDVERRLADLNQPVRALGEMARDGLSLQQRSETSHRLAASLLGVQAALADGHALEERLRKLQATSKKDGQKDGDPFVGRVLARLPEATLRRGADPVPTEPELRRSFADQLHTLKAAALEPSAEGLLGRLLARFAGRFLARLYAVPAPVDGLHVADAASEEARFNLDVLSTAASKIASGDVRGALQALEALVGASRVSAGPWMLEARHTLLLQQTLQAAQAKASCLNAALLE